MPTPKSIKHGRFFSKAKDCARCPLKRDYLSKGQVNKAVVISDDYPVALLCARRREQCRGSTALPALPGAAQPKAQTAQKAVTEAPQGRGYPAVTPAWSP
jgi:hypothetical protein